MLYIYSHSSPGMNWIQNYSWLSHFHASPSFNWGKSRVRPSPRRHLNLENSGDGPFLCLVNKKRASSAQPLFRVVLSSSPPSSTQRHSPGKYSALFGFNDRTHKKRCISSYLQRGLCCYGDKDKEGAWMLIIGNSFWCVQEAVWAETHLFLLMKQQKKIHPCWTPQLMG